MNMDYAKARQKMTLHQIRANRVTDPLVIDAIATVPREAFVPPALRGIAYRDEDLPIGAGRYLMEPMVLGRLLQLAAVKPTDVVLDIGCATGYSSGVLACMAATVIALESNFILAKTATALLADQGIDNTAVVTAPLAEGYPAQAPYDVIVFEGVIDHLPETIRHQLADGGRLVAMMREGPIATAFLLTRVGAVFSHRTEFEATTAPLPGFERKEGFVF